MSAADAEMRLLAKGRRARERFCLVEAPEESRIGRWPLIRCARPVGHDGEHVGSGPPWRWDDGGTDRPIGGAA